VSPRTRGIVIAALHGLLLASVGGTLLVDRVRLPRAWALTAPVDPSDPFRGRYVRLRVLAVPTSPAESLAALGWARLSAKNGELVAEPGDTRNGVRVTSGADSATVVVAEPLAYFIPPDVPDPSVMTPGRRLWVQVSVPERGAPRPISLESRPLR